MQKDAPLHLLESDPRVGDGRKARRLFAHEVRTAVCVFDVRRRVRSAALELGFTRIAAEELTIVASELCSNIVKYATRGVMTLDAVADALRGTALALAASDKGPHFRAFERATRDRSDDTGSIPPEAMYARPGIGGGLAAVRRLSHGIFLDQNDRGKTIVVIRYIRSIG